MGYSRNEAGYWVDDGGNFLPGQHRPGDGTTPYDNSQIPKYHLGADGNPVYDTPTGTWDANAWSREQADKLNPGYDPSKYGTPSPAPAAPSGGGGGDAWGAGTQPYVNAINQWGASMQQPLQNPDFQPMVDYLRKYFAQLQGPAFTNAQMDLMQTQALDPLQQQHDAAKQQVIQRLAARGINPGSGIVEKALQDVDRAYGEMRTGTQRDFATKAIGVDQANKATAAQVAQTLTGLQNQQGTLNEGRAMQAIGLLGQIPALEDSRQAAAAQLLNYNSPYAANPFALSQYQNMQNQQSGQSNTAMVMQLLSQLLMNAGQTGSRF